MLFFYLGYVLRIAFWEARSWTAFICSGNLAVIVLFHCSFFCASIIFHRHFPGGLGGLFASKDLFVDTKPDGEIGAMALEWNARTEITIGLENRVNWRG